MGCTFKARFNQLWSIWYTLLVLSVQSYLLYLGFERYKLYNEMKWPKGAFPKTWLTTYIALYAACVPGSLLFFAVGIFKSGNIAGDNEKLADREDRTIEISRNRKGEKSGCLHRVKALWQHSPPQPQLIHILMALSQLIAQQLMIAQLYRHGFINSGDFLNTELDFVYQRARQLATNLPMGDTRLQGFRITADELSGSPLAPNLLPLLMHVRLFGIPLEFVNFVIALISFSCTYPSVFWRVNKAFSFVFSFHLLIYTATTIWSYLSFSILYRIQETNINSLRPVGLGQYLVSSHHFPFYHPYAIIGTFLITFALTTIAPVALYTYGYNKYYINLMNLQSKNLIRSGNSSGHSEYSKKSTYGQHTRNLCCDGYGPHTVAIVLLVLIVLVKAPTIYALMILYQHDERPILLTCIIVDVIYLFTWIILWLMLTLKREWNFAVSHKAHHIYALQKFGAAGHIHGNENPSNLKNAMIVLHRDHMFVTDDQVAKQSLLKHIQKQQTDVTDEVYWQKKNGHGSPGIRKVPMDEAIKNTPEMSRLMYRSSEEHSRIGDYQQGNRGAVHHNHPTSINNRGNSTPPENSFGTLQRSQQTSYTTLQRNAPSATLQRSIPPGQWASQQEAYASIHKQKVDAVLQRRGSNDGSSYGQIDHYGAYGTYSRIPNQTRIPVQPGQQIQNMRINGNTYAVQQSNTLQRRPSDSTTPNSVIGIRQSPLLSERSTNAVAAPSLNTSNREQSPYQRSTVKLSSFNGEKTGGFSSSTPNQWAAQRAPPGQPSQLLWNQNKASMSTSSSQQDAQCFTPTSTLTSHGSTGNYSNQHTPTPGSPQASSTYSRNQGGGGIYGTLGDDAYAEKTLQKQGRQSTGSTSVRHTVKITGGRNDDSANFSLTSSNGSNDTSRQLKNDYATSIV